MQKIKYYFNRIRKMKSKEFLRIVNAHVYIAFGTRIVYIHDKYLPTHRHERISKSGLCPIKINMNEADYSGFDIKVAKELWRMFQSHRFDLLGSGWQDAGFHNKIQGFHGHRYEYEFAQAKGEDFLEKVLKKKDVKYAKKVWKLIRGNYSPIDWQRDFKSGYRWGADIWYRPVKLADKQGGDIKMPWELSRMQHLPRLALLYRLLPECKKDIAVEYQNQILDFIAQNPIRMGVCFMCPMDIGIRIANIVLSYSMFCALGYRFSSLFQQILCNHIIESCNHIRKNLELSSRYNSNHYFADIAGILYGASVMPVCKKRVEWLDFARNEIDKEIKKQFNSDGTNKEGSVAYHRLTAEMALYSVALIRHLSMNGQLKDVSKETYDIVGQACMFMADITRPDGNFPSIGDNDGGVFFRFSFTGNMITPKEAKERYANLDAYYVHNDDEWYYDENICDGRTLVAAGLGLFSNLKQKDDGLYYFETSLISALICGKKVKSYIKDMSVFEVSTEEKESFTFLYKESWEIKLETKTDRNEMQIRYYPDFGVVIYRCDSLYLCIDVVYNGQNGNAGHAHNDKLSFELMDNGKIIYEDPGTYVYTADINLRDRFRSVCYHNTIQIGEEQNVFNGTFSMFDETRCNIVKANRNEFIGEVRYRDIIHRRTIRFTRRGLMIIDECNKSFDRMYDNIMCTRGYGKLLRNKWG